MTPAVEAVRLSLHVLAAAVWVGGQITLAGLVPRLRAFGREVTVASARQFNMIAWPAFAVLVGTGIWNVIAVNPSTQTTAWQVTLWVKLAVVVLSGAAAFAHGRARSQRGVAVWGSLSGTSAVAAMVLGVVIAN